MPSKYWQINFFGHAGGYKSYLTGEPNNYHTKKGKPTRCRRLCKNIEFDLNKAIIALVLAFTQWSRIIRIYQMMS